MDYTKKLIVQFAQLQSPCPAWEGFDFQILPKTEPLGSGWAELGRRGLQLIAEVGGGPGFGLPPEFQPAVDIGMCTDRGPFSKDNFPRTARGGWKIIFGNSNFQTCSLITL